MKKNSNNFKIILGALVGTMIGGLTVFGANQTIQAWQNMEIKVSLNGQVQTFKDEKTGETQYPITYNDRTYLPLRNIAQLTGLDVDYDVDTKTAILNSKSKISNTDNWDWKNAYFDIIRSVSDTWEYNAQTKFGFVYLNDDDIAELVFGSPSTSLLIYSYDTEKNCAYLLRTCTTGARGATNITYVEKENIVIEKSGGMLFESEYQDKEGCIHAFGTWGGMTKLDTGWNGSWNVSTFVFDENDSSKDIVEKNMSKEVEEYLAREKEFDLAYTKEEAQKAVYEL